MTDSNPRDPKERRGNTPFVAFGIIIGASLGTVVFAVTQNVFWIAERGTLVTVLGQVRGNIAELSQVENWFLG